MIDRPALRILCCAVLACQLAACAPHRAAAPAPSVSQVLAAQETQSPDSAALAAQPAEAKSPDARFRDDPAARALYEAMVKAMRDAETLSWRGAYRFSTGSQERQADFSRPALSTYVIWLKKPNFFRVEGYFKGYLTGVLVCDGEYSYVYWPAGRRQRSDEKEGAAKDEYEKTRLTSYTKTYTPLACHSISHDVSDLNAGLGMLIVDPSTFHGSTDSLQEYIDCIQTVGSESVLGQDCDVIRVSFMRGQREWFLYLAKTDHLPRRLREVVHVNDDLFIEELRTKVSLNAPVSEDKFSWKPPEGWTEYREPALDKSLLASGALAPDFELSAVDGSRIRLSDYRGKVVWMYVWRAG